MVHYSPTIQLRGVPCCGGLCFRTSELMYLTNGYSVVKEHRGACGPLNPLLQLLGCGHFDIHTVQPIPILKTVFHKAPVLLYGQAPVAFHNSVPFLLCCSSKPLDAIHLLIDQICSFHCVNSLNFWIFEGQKSRRSRIAAKRRLPSKQVHSLLHFWSGNKKDQTSGTREGFILSRS